MNVVKCLLRVLVYSISSINLSSLSFSFLFYLVSLLSFLFLDKKGGITGWLSGHQVLLGT